MQLTDTNSACRYLVLCDLMPVAVQRQFAVFISRFGVKTKGLCPISPNPNSRKPVSFTYFPKEEMPMTSN